MTTNQTISTVEAIPEESRLVARAQSGEANAFLELYDVYSDDLYRYIYFRVLNDVAAEAITSQVFRHAWDRIASYRKRGSTFAGWLYKIARNQVLIYHKVNLGSDSLDPRSPWVSADYLVNQEAQDWSAEEALGYQLHILTGDIEQSRLQTTAALIMRAYLDYLNPRRSKIPSPTFNAYTRSWLVRYLQLHPHRPKPSRMRQFVSTTRAIWAQTLRPLVPRPTWSGMRRRVAVVYAVLIAALLITGTAEAQSALPGDALYGWKRASEQVWLSVSPDPVGTDILLANRRLSEWMAVENDPRRSASALHDYLSALSTLNSAGDTQSRARVLPMLEAHKKTLKDSGLSSQPLYTYLIVAANSASSSLAAQATSTAAVLSAPPLPTLARPTATGMPTEVISPATAVPTEVAPTATEVPTEVPPTATEVPTEVPPTATNVPTDVPTQVPTEVPTEAPTDVPTQVIPTAGAAPTDIPPAPTDTPPAGIPLSFP